MTDRPLESLPSEMSYNTDSTFTIRLKFMKKEEDYEEDK